MSTSAFLSDIMTRPRLIGMIHLPALPGTPAATLTPDGILAAALAEARILREAGIDTVMVENMHDVPYTRHPGPEITAMVTRVATELVAMGLHVGIQILAGANREALAAALASGAEFIRVEGFVYAHIADEGFMEACAGELLRYRRALGAEHIAILADIKKKHCSHAITADVSLAETARTAAYFKADGIVVSGTRTGSPVHPEDLHAVREAVDCPVVVGSGVTPENLPRLLPLAHGLIVGSALKQRGHWTEPLHPAAVTRLVETFASCL